MSDKTRFLAFYLPQYHPIPENDEWWGNGFTEWTNVRKAQPRFPGHYQPHVPGPLGYYDLRDPKARAAQADLAREYGIHGFCYYHYWFNGKRLLETPLNEVLRTGEPDFPFCLCWANENWTRRWDGKDHLVLMEQHYSSEDDVKHIQSLFKVFDDKRYIRINGKPLFLVYRIQNMPDPARTADIWRNEARRAGIGELYLAQVEATRYNHPNPFTNHFDAEVEFAPDWKECGPTINPKVAQTFSTLSEYEIETDYFLKNSVRYYGDLVERMLNKSKREHTWFRCVTPSWDNSARRSEDAIVFFGSTPDLYYRWLKKIVAHTDMNLVGDEKIIFINGWNEWAEGNHLEPDLKFGKKYLEATLRALTSNNESFAPVSDCTPFLIECIYKQRIVNLQKIIDDNEKSLSWRIVEPFRKISNQVKRLKIEGK